MKRFLKALLSLTLVLSTITMTFPQVSYAVEESKPVTHGNEVITYSVSENGHFSIRTTEEGSPYRESDGNMSLLYEDGENNTSFATFKIDGEDYIFGQRYAYSLSKKARITGKTISTDDSIITTYTVGDHIEIQQTLSYVSDQEDTNYGNVFIRYSVNNTSGHDIQVGARLLEDVMLGDNDGAAIKVDDNFYDKEIAFEGSEVPEVWRATDNEFAPNVVAYGYTSGWGNKRPDRMVVGSWLGLSQTPYDYTPDSSVNFTMESDYGHKDTGIAYYWNPKSISNNETSYFETYYGLGQITGTELTYATNIFAPTQLVVNDEHTGYTDDGEFEVDVMIENNLSTSEEIYNVMAYLTFEDGGGAVSLDNDAALKGVKLIKKNGQFTFRWKLKAKAGEDYNSIRYKVNLYDDRNLYKEGDTIPEGAQVGDVKMDEIYTVSKALILPSKSGKAPSVGFESVSPDEIYYSGKNLITFKTSGTTLLVDKDKWQLEYSLNGGDYTVIPKDQINVLKETNSVEVNFEQAFEPGEMKFRLNVVKSLYTDGTDDENIIAGDILYIPGALKVTKDKAAMQRTYGMLALVEEYNGDHQYTLPFVIADKSELGQLQTAIDSANASDGKNREILVTISGDVRAIREGGKVVRYVVYAQNKKAVINDLVTYTSAIPMTIEYAEALSSPTRRTIDFSSSANSGISSTLKNKLDETTILNNMFPAGQDAPGLQSDVSFDFPYASDLPSEMTDAAKQITGVSQALDTLSSTGIAPGEDYINGKVGRLTITGMGVLGMNSKDGFDFWMDKFCMEFLDDHVYTLDEGNEDADSIQLQLGGIGSVLNKVLEGMPVQIGGVRLVRDDEADKDMLTFDASVDLTFLPGGVSADAKDVYFSNDGFEGLIVDASVAPEDDIGIVSDLELAVGVDTYNNVYSIEGGASIKVVSAEVRFTIAKERRNGKWYLDRLVIAGGGDPGIPVIPGAIYITKLGGGVKNLQEITNPYYDGGGSIFTVVLIAGVSVDEILTGDFEGNITKRSIKVTSDEAELFDMDILRDVEFKLQWADDSGSDYFYLSQKASLDLLGIIEGTCRLAITDSSFEGTAKASIKIPDSVDLVGGKKVGHANMGVNLDKVWGTVGISLPTPLPTVDFGATYYWRGSFKFNIGEAGPMVEGPQGALYNGTMTDENDETVNYSIGTNVNLMDNTMTEAGATSLRPVTMLTTNQTSQPFVSLQSGTPTPETVYVHADGTTQFDGKNVYKISLASTDASNLVLRHATADPTKDSNLKLYHITGNTVDGKAEVDETEDTLAYAEHQSGDQEYDTVTGFTERELTDYLVVSDTPISHYLVYTDGQDYADFANDYTYEVTMDTTSNTRLAFTSDENADIQIYKVNNAGEEGMSRVTKATDIKEDRAQFNGKKVVIFSGFPDGESDATYYVSASQALEQQNLLDAQTIEIHPSTSEFDSLMVEQFVSKSNIKEAPVFYITDDDGNILDFFQERETVTEDPDYDNLFNTLSIDGEDYYTMMYPFEAPTETKTYHVYSTTKIDADKSKLYEIEAMPELDQDSVEVKTNAQSGLKKDVTWSGQYYRYNSNEAKGTGRTVFTYYLADNKLILDENGNPEFDPKRLLGTFEPVKGDKDYHILDMPVDVQSGDYRILMVMSTEGLSQDIAYSEPFTFVNPNMPKDVVSVTATPHGNGYLDVKWTDPESVKSYYVEVFDDEHKMIDAFGTAEVSGDKREVLVGGVYENFDPDHPEDSTVTGLETGKTYTVGVTPVKQADDTLTVIGNPTYSTRIYLPEPDPATLTMSLEGNQIYTRSTDIKGVDEKGQTFTDTVEVTGTNVKNPVVQVESDQVVSITAELNGVQVYASETAVDTFDIPLNKVPEGLNYLTVVTHNENGDVSDDTLSFYIDSRAPELMISQPNNNDIVTSDVTSVSVQGKTENSAQILINGMAATVDDKGFFSGMVAVDLEATKTKIDIVAQDDFGNQTESKMTVIRNLEPIAGIKLSSNVPEKTQTIEEPIYDTSTVSMVNPFTGVAVEVPVAENDEVIGTTERTLTTNVVEMGKTYQLDVTGVAEDDSSVPLDTSRVKYELVQGESIASIDNSGLLKVNNTGTMVVKASYSLLDESQGATDGKDPFAFTEYMTVTSDYKDIYSDLPDQETSDGKDDNPPAPSNPSSGNTNTPPPVVDSNQPTLEDELGQLIGHINSSYSEDADGKVIQTVRIDSRDSDKMIDSTQGKSSKIINLVLPKNSKTKITSIDIAKNAVESLSQAQIGLKVVNDYSAIQMKAEDLKELASQVEGDLIFNIEPVENSKQTQDIVELVKADTGISEAIKQAEMKLEGDSIHVTSNMGKMNHHQLEVVLPIDENKIPSGYDSAIDYLKSLEAYVQHDDGTTELLPVEIVAMSHKDDIIQYGAKVAVTHLSTFTLLSVEGTQNSKVDERQPYMSGYDQGIFKPEQTMTRGELAAMLNNTLMKDYQGANKETLNDFSDVSPQFWGYDAIMKARRMGLMNGSGNNIFAPNRAITRAEMATIIAKYLGLEGKTSKTFTDTQNHWAQNSIGLVADAGIFSGYGDGSFKPNASITRAEAVVVMNKILGRKKGHIEVDNPWHDVSSHAWYYKDVIEATVKHVCTIKNDFDASYSIK